MSRTARVLSALLLVGGPVAAQTNSVTIAPAGYVVVSPTTVPVTVTGEFQFVTADPSSGRSERCTVRNTDTATDTFSPTVAGCSSGAIATACSGVPSTVVLSAGEIAPVSQPLMNHPPIRRS